MAHTPHQESFRGNFLRHWPTFALGFLCVGVCEFMQSMVPVTLGQGIDYIKHAMDNKETLAAARPGLRTFVLLIIAYASGRALFRVLGRLLIFNTGRRIEYEIRAKLFAHVLSLPMLTLNRLGVGDVMSRLTNDLANVRALFGFGILNIVSRPIQAAIFLTQMLLISPLLTGITFIPLLLITLLIRKYGYPLFELNREIANQLGKITAKVQETLAQITTLKLFSQEKVREAAFAKTSDDYLNLNMSAARQKAFLFPFSEFLFALGILLIVFTGGWQITQKTLTIGEFSTFLIFLRLLEEPVRMFGFVFGTFNRGQAALSRLNELFAVAPDLHWGEGEDPKAFQGELEAVNLSLSLGGRPIIQDLNLTVKPGQMVGITGPIGAGKTSLLNLLARVYDPHEGAITVSGKPPFWFNALAWRAGVGYATQEPFLFAATIEENISFGASEPGKNKVLEAAAMAGLTKDLERLGKGLDTLVGERGITLSGGQKQRLSLARALMSAPPILILDDCFSAVDTVTEARIIEGLRKAGENRTIVFATHRLSAMPYCDTVYVLDQGRIIQSGAHNDLVGEPGLYQELWNRQKLEEALA